MIKFLSLSAISNSRFGTDWRDLGEAAQRPVRGPWLVQESRRWAVEWERWVLSVTRWQHNFF